MSDEHDGTGRVVAVNVGSARTLQWNGRKVTTAIYKAPVPGRHDVRGVNIAGDDQADRTVHGGPDMAVYAYDAADYRWWSDQLGAAPGPGTFGENLTVEGLDLRAAAIGERWQVGTTVLRVTQPRIPCYKLGIRMEDPRFPARFAAAGRPGTYLAIEQEGTVGADDQIVVLTRPEHGITVGTVERAYHGDRDLVERLLAVEELPDGWRQWARTVVEHRGHRG